MRGISRLTAAIIQTRGDDVRCLAGGPNDHGKWTGWISLYRDNIYDHDLLNTQPVFDSETAAVSAMEDVVSKIRALPQVDIFASIRFFGGTLR